MDEMQAAYYLVIVLGSLVALAILYIVHILDEQHRRDMLIFYYERRVPHKTVIAASKWVDELISGSGRASTDAPREMSISHYDD